MYQQFDAELPAITIALLSISEFMRTPKYSVGTLFLIILFVYIYRYLIKNNYEIRKGWHRFIFKIPIFGLLLKKSIIARVALVLGNLRSAGVDMIETLDIAKSVTTNLIIIEAIENVKRGVFSGKPMGALFEKEKIFPTTFYQLVSVGDKTGKLDDMLNSLAIYYEEEFDDSVANLSTLIEPVMIVFMGVLIGGLLLAMYMPILGIGSAI
jgi:type IV pilus assembly protein PilC